MLSLPPAALGVAFAASCTIAALLTPVAACSPKAETPAEPLKNFQNARISVTQLYAENCANCHGDQGQGGGAGTKTLLTQDKFDQKWDKPFFDAIKNGVPAMGMSKYGETMTDAQIWGLVVNIREKQGKALRAEFGSPKPVNGVYKSQHHDFKVETVVNRGAGLKTPWSLDFLPDGRMLVTNRGGSLHFISKSGELSSAIEAIPASVEQGQGGLMEVAVHPDYAKNGWIYLSLADPAKNGNGAMTKIVRGKIEGNQWTSTQTIFEVDQKFYTRAGVHFGSKIVFDGKGHIIFTVGERGENMPAQELTSPVGKNYRAKDDGSVPSDNPFVNHSEAAANPFVKLIWSYGHRNQQGLVLLPNGDLYNTEHGPRGGDEVNKVEKGANFGWPVIGFSINYQDTPRSTPWPTADQKMNLPLFRWLPSIGASGMDYVKGVAFPNWRGDIIAGGLAGQNVDRFRVKGNQLIERTELIHGMGRVRDLATAPDGTIYVVLNGPDMIIRMVPAK